MSSILSFVGWAILPNYATSLLQSIYYGITVRAGEPRPQPPSPVYARHRRRVFILVITAYLLYTLYETFHQVQVAGDFYQVLGVSPIANDRAVKSRFRRLAALHHPDKVGHGSGDYGSGGAAGDDYFVYLKLAQDTLLDPARRFAYDRFGPEIVNWGSGEKSMENYLYGALQNSVVPQYVGGLLTILFLNFTWWADWGRYWRFFTFAALLTLELTLITQPLTIFMPSSFLPETLRNLFFRTRQPFYLLPFQILTLARQVSITLHIFISQLAPPSTKKSSPKPSAGTAGDKLSRETLQNLTNLAALSRANDAEATRLLQMEYAPFRGDQEGSTMLRKGMKEGVVLNSVRMSRGVQEVVKGVVERDVWQRVDKKDE